MRAWTGQDALDFRRLFGQEAYVQTFVAAGLANPLDPAVRARAAEIRGQTTPLELSGDPWLRAQVDGSYDVQLEATRAVEAARRSVSPAPAVAKAAVKPSTPGRVEEAKQAGEKVNSWAVENRGILTVAGLAVAVVAFLGRRSS